MSDASDRKHHRRSAAAAAADVVAVLRCSSRSSAASSLTGLGAWAYQMYNGIGVTGINWPVFWAFYITNFVFWIGISHAGTLISAILRLVNAGWRRPVTRCAEVDHGVRADDRRDVSDHPPRPAVAVLLADAVSEQRG